MEPSFSLALAVALAQNVLFLLVNGAWEWRLSILGRRRVAQAERAFHDRADALQATWEEESKKLRAHVDERVSDAVAHLEEATADDLAEALKGVEERVAAQVEARVGAQVAPLAQQGEAIGQGVAHLMEAAASKGTGWRGGDPREARASREEQADAIAAAEESTRAWLADQLGEKAGEFCFDYLRRNPQTWRRAMKAIADGRVEQAQEILSPGVARFSLNVHERGTPAAPNAAAPPF